MGGLQHLRSLLVFPDAADEARAGVQGDGPASTARPTASSALALARVAARARQEQLAVLELGRQPAGEVRELAPVVAAIVRQCLRDGHVAVPTLLLGAGPLRDEGRTVDGASWLLALGLALESPPALHAAALSSAPALAAPAVRAATGSRLGTVPDGKGSATASIDAGGLRLALLAPDTPARIRALGGDAPMPRQPGHAAELLARIGALEPVAHTAAAPQDDEILWAVLLG